MSTKKRKLKTDKPTWCESLGAALKDKFEIDFETEYNLFAGPYGGAYVTKRADGKKMTREQITFIDGFMQSVNRS